MNKKWYFFGLLPIIACVAYFVFDDVVSTTNKATKNMLPAVAEVGVSEFYLLKNECVSYYYYSEMDDQNYQVGKKERHNTVLINPRIEGERVYVKELGLDFYFFFIDSVEKATVSVYKVKSNAKCYIEKEEGLRDEDLRWEAKEDMYLINPKIEEWHKVYLMDNCGDGKKRFIERSDAELLNPSVLRMEF